MGSLGLRGGRHRCLVAVSAGYIAIGFKGSLDNGWVGGVVHTHRPLAIGSGGDIVGGFLDEHGVRIRSHARKNDSKATKLEQLT